jgi:branched-chain amino acid transport system substrate-binding protein
MKKLIGALGIVIVVILVAYFISGSSTKADFKIGYIGPITGPLGVSTGESVIQGFKLANQNNPVINNRKITVIYEDDACSDIKKAVSAAQKLIEIDKVDVLVNGLCSGSTLAVAPIAEKNKVVMITPGAAAPSISKAGDYVFRLAASSATGGAAVVDLIKDKGYKTIGFIYENNEYPIGWKDAFTLEYLKSYPNVKFVEESAIVGANDFRTQITKVMAANPDVIIALPLMPTAANVMLNQVRELGFKKPLIGNEIFSLQSVIHNKNSEGMFVTVYRNDTESLEFMSFLGQYKKVYGKDIQEALYGAISYDTYNLIADSVKACASKNSDCIKDFLYGVKDYNGISGSITIDSNGDAVRDFSLKQIVDGKVAEIK